MTPADPATPTPADARASLAEDIANLDVFLAAYASHPDCDVIASVIDPTDDLLTLGELRRILAALTAEIAEGAVGAWQPIERAPKDKRIIARGHDWGRFNNPFHLAEVVWDADSGEWRNAYDPDQTMKYLTEWLITAPATPVGAIAEGRS